MKRLYIGILLSLFALLTLQAQESEPNIPRILGFDCGGSNNGWYDFYSHGVTSLELIGCTALTSLDCCANQLTSLDVSKNTALTDLDCGSNQLTSLDVSGCTALETLSCSYNRLTSLDVSKNTALRELGCSGNISQVLLSDERGFDLSTLPGMDVKRVRAMSGGHIEGSILYFDADEVNYVYDVGGGREATFCLIAPHSGDVCDTLQCEFTRTPSSVVFSFYGFGRFLVDWGDGSRDMLTGGGISDRISVRHSYDSSGCNTVRLCGLEGQDRLLGLSCRGKELSSLDVSGCTVLTSLDCSYNDLTSLDVSGCTVLTSLDCSYNDLTSLDVSKNTALTDLDCGGNQLTSLDVSKNTALTYLYCGGNQLTSLDVSKNTSLTYLGCGNNQLASLDVSKNTSLTSLGCGNNQLASLDVSKNTSLTSLYCYNNQLTSLDVSGCTALENLECGKDYYSHGGGNKLTSLDVSGCTALRGLNCSNNQLTSIDVSKNTALTDLDCGSNQLTSLDVSQNTALTYLYCDNNQLTSLDVSGCTALAYLKCYDNQLNSLDVSGCTALEYLDCNSNRIPLSGLYETYSGFPAGNVEFYADGQSDSIVLLVGEAFDLTSERRIENEFSTYKIKSATGNVLPSYLYEEQGFVFRFNEEYTYLLEIQNPAVSEVDSYYNSRDVTFTWHITVLESLADYLTVQVAANHAEWGRVGVSGNGRFKAGATATVTATPNAGYRFVSWTKKDGTVLSTQAAYTFTVTEDVELTANFAEAERHTVLLSANHSTWGEVYQSGGGLYAEGERVTIIATAKTGYHFINWTKKDGAVFATEATHTFTVTEDLELTANFGEQRPETHTVVLSANNEAYGSVSQTGSGTYEQGTEATITATANEGYRFVNWTKKDGTVFTAEATHTFTVTEDVELTANFEKRAEEVDTYTVLLSANNNDYGRVSQTGDGTYEAGEEVTITATAKAGYGFVNWTRKDGSVFSTRAVHTFAVTENLELTANFEEEEPETYTVVLSANPPAWGSVYQTGGGIYEEGAQATVIAMANAGYRFINWTEKDGGVFATEAAHTFTVTEDVALTANFEKLPDAGNGGMEADNLYVYVKDNTIHLSEERGMVRVYNAAGVCVYSGQGMAIPVHSSGLYIVHVGGRAYKAVVR